MTHPEILRAERFGSRALAEEADGVCVECEGFVDKVDDEMCTDGCGRLFCSEECFLKYYGYKRLKIDKI